MNQSKKYGYFSLVIFLVLSSSGITSIYFSKKMKLKGEEIIVMKEREREFQHSLNEYKKLASATSLYFNGKDSQADLLFDELRNSNDSLVFLAIEKHDLYLSNKINTPNNSKVQFVKNKVSPTIIPNDLESEKDLIRVKNDLAFAKNQLNLIQKQKIILNLVSTKGKKFQYIGETKLGIASGYGIGIFETGSIYKGYWKNNMRDGKGVFSWKDKEYYEGHFVLDKRDGFGEYHWKNEEIYRGFWKNDKRQGEGKLYSKNGKIKEEGLWENDILK